MGFEMNIKRIRYAVAHLLFVMICAGGLSMSACTTVPKQDGYSNMFVVTDLCFCEFTDHGHCGILDIEHESVNNDATLEILAKQLSFEIFSARKMLMASSISSIVHIPVERITLLKSSAAFLK